MSGSDAAGVILRDISTRAGELGTRLVLFVLLVAVVLAVSRPLRPVLRARLGRRGGPSFTRVFTALYSTVFALLAVLLAATLAFPSVRMVDVLASLGVVSVAIGFAFKDVLENLLAGVLLLLRDPFKSGDQIRVGEYEGSVEGITVREMLLRTHAGQRVLLPNAFVYTSPLEVLTHYRDTRLAFAVALDIGADLDRARTAITAALAQLPEVRSAPSPDAVVTEVRVGEVTVECRAWTTGTRAGLTAAAMQRSRPCSRPCPRRASRSPSATCCCVPRRFTGGRRRCDRVDPAGLCRRVRRAERRVRRRGVLPRHRRPHVDGAHRRTGDRRAERVVAALRSLSTQLSGAQLGITITSLAVGYLIEPSVGRLLAGPLALAGLPDPAAAGLAVTLALVVMTAFQMAGRVGPEELGDLTANAGGTRGSTEPQPVHALARPLIAALNEAANAVLRRLDIEPQEELRSARRPQELAAVAARSAVLGTLDVGVATLIQRATEFGDRSAEDVMTPRTRVQFVPAAADVAQLLSLCATTGHARFPVVEGGNDAVVGVVHFKHALSVPPEERPHRRVREVMRPVATVPSSLRLDAVLDVLQQPGLQLAVVVDEYGGTDGIVTLEDLVEEVAGEIVDEQDRRLDDALQLEEGVWSLSGLLRPDQVARGTGLELPSSAGAETIAGLVVDRLGHVPGLGEAVVVRAAADRGRPDADGVPTASRVRLQVAELDGLRVSRVTMTWLDPPDDATGQAP